MKQQKQHKLVEKLKNWLHKIMPETDFRLFTKWLEQEEHSTPSLAASSLKVGEVEEIFGREFDHRDNIWNLNGGDIMPVPPDLCKHIYFFIFYFPCLFSTPT
jgi:hypothetical protein